MVEFRNELLGHPYVCLTHAHVTARGVRLQSKMVYQFLCMCKLEDRRISVSLNTLSEMLDTPRDTISRCLQELCSVGWLRCLDSVGNRGQKIYEVVDPRECLGGCISTDCSVEYSSRSSRELSQNHVCQESSLSQNHVGNGSSLSQKPHDVYDIPDNAMVMGSINDLLDRPEHAKILDIYSKAGYSDVVALSQKQLSQVATVTTNTFIYIIYNIIKENVLDKVIATVAKPDIKVASVAKPVKSEVTPVPSNKLSIEKMVAEVASKTDEVRAKRSIKRGRAKKFEGDNLEVDREKLIAGSSGNAKDLAEIFRVKYKRYRKIDFAPKRADIKELKNWKVVLDKYEDVELIEGTITYCMKDWEMVAGRYNIQGEPTPGLFQTGFMQSFVLEYQRGGPTEVVDKFSQMRKRESSRGEAPKNKDWDKEASLGAGWNTFEGSKDDK